MPLDSRSQTPSQLLKDDARAHGENANHHRHDLVPNDGDEVAVDVVPQRDGQVVPVQVLVRHGRERRERIAADVAIRHRLHLHLEYEPGLVHEARPVAAVHDAEFVHGHVSGHESDALVGEQVREGERGAVLGVVREDVRAGRGEDVVELGLVGGRFLEYCFVQGFFHGAEEQLGHIVVASGRRAASVGVVHELVRAELVQGCIDALFAELKKFALGFSGVVDILGRQDVCLVANSSEMPLQLTLFSVTYSNPRLSQRLICIIWVGLLLPLLEELGRQ